MNYYFYQGTINLVTTRDTETFKVTQKFNTTLDFIRDQLAFQLTENDTVGISYMGLELFSLAKTNSINTLYLEESPLDGKGNIKGNLMSILDNRVPYIHKVEVDQKSYHLLANKNVCMDKVVLKG